MTKIPFIPIPGVDLNRLESPRLAKVLDTIRFELSKNDPDGEMDEFTRFMRE